MRFNEYQEKVETFMNPETIETRESRILNASLGLGGESGECLDIVKKWAFHGQNLDIPKLKKEIGDVLFYASEMASSIDFTLEEAAQMNVDKLTARYPNGFNTEDSVAKKDEHVVG